VFARCGLVLLVLSGAGRLTAQEPTAPPAAEDAATATLNADQLQSLVAPIALYPDELLAQTLVASTYPLEVIQLQQWLMKHPDLEDEALADSVATQPWDPSVQSMAAVPEVVERLANDIQWTTELGNAFLAQQPEVMDAVQEMRKKAQDKGALESNEQQTVETQTVEGTTVIVVESANPEVIYVPSYNPVYVYPPPVYAYPPIYYPPYTAGAAFVSFSIGVMWGAAIWGGSCCHAGWGGNNIYINNNNNFNQINHRGDINRGQGGRGDNWQHNPEHRGAAPYGDQRTADKFGGSSRGQGAGASTGVSNRAAGGTGTRTGGAAGVSDRSAAGVSDRPAAGASDRSAAGTSGNRSAAGVSDRAAAGTSGSRGGESIGNQSIPTGSRSSGFSGGSSGYSGSSARASSSRGASSMNRSRSGGRRR
jgi:hypothetical protein